MNKPFLGELKSGPGVTGSDWLQQTTHALGGVSEILVDGQRHAAAFANGIGSHRALEILLNVKGQGIDRQRYAANSFISVLGAKTDAVGPKEAHAPAVRNNKTHAARPVPGKGLN